ncbi:marine proteobacterial sortase target protein [Shewanella sp. Isolate11]|uniref:marine proteobacterial sortase target protein n=1 Tax=Shewanella sp. Isolate11 TaxID=2908530 RepID=UPI001EFDF8E9|nr:marine proteobacterial sortase target protein [Shewanella sp. Isolate11]MCG9696487.1 marine proteobacterial sortase target protein [Shewanella sp. Isolate11]
MAIQHLYFTQLSPLRGAFFFNLSRWFMWLFCGLCLPLCSLSAQESVATLGSAKLVYSSVLSTGEISQFVALPIETQVQMQISGWINRVHVKQRFRNNSQQWLNGNYQFPLPHNAAIDAMTLQIGQRIIEGEIQTKAEAKKQFEQAKKMGKKASLVEQQKPNMFVTQVANLAPGETLIVDIAYQQQVDYRSGLYSLRFPMAITPRYQPESDAQVLQVDSELKQEKHNQLMTELGQVDLRIELNAGLPISEIDSPYHTLVRSEQGDVIQLALAEIVKPERDFVLNWRPELGLAPTAVAFTQQGRTHGIAGSATASDYGMVMLMPPQDKVRVALPRELILVIDTSGSMEGRAIVQAKQALKQALSGLTNQDSFNIIAFNSDLTSLSAQSMTVNSQNLKLAMQFVNGLKANGGTEMAPAFLRALQTGSPQQGLSQLKQVVFITDGAVNNEQQLFELIEMNLGNARLFTVGIGAAPNGYFMQRAAAAGRGTYTYVGKLAEVNDKINQLMLKIAQPVVSNIELSLADGTIPDYWPANISDLYAGEPLMVAIRLMPKNHHGSSNELLVSGELGGQFWQQQIVIQRQSKMMGLDLLWASNKIAALLASKSRYNHQSIKKQVTQVALQYHLVSPYTSLIAVDKTLARPVGEQAIDIHAHSLLPINGSGWPKTASGSRLYIAIGGVLLLLLLIYWLSFLRVSKQEIEAL